MLCVSKEIANGIGLRFNFSFILFISSTDKGEPCTLQVPSFSLYLPITVLISIIVWFSADMIIELFGLGPEAAKYCLAHIRAVALITVVLSVYVPIFGLFQGAGYSILPMVVATCALFVRVSVTYLLRYSPFLGHTIVWWNGIFGYGVGFTITWSFYLSGLWNKNKNINLAEDL